MFVCSFYVPFLQVTTYMTDTVVPFYYVLLSVLLHSFHFLQSTYTHVLLLLSFQTQAITYSQLPTPGIPPYYPSWLLGKANSQTKTKCAKN